MSKSIALSFILALTFASATAQRININVSASLQQACLSDTVRIDYVITGDTDYRQPTVVQADGFRMVGKSQSENRETTLVNGEYITTRSITFTYRYIPLQTGMSVLPVIKLTDSKGQQYHSPGKLISIVADCRQHVVNPRFEDDYSRLSGFTEAAIRMRTMPRFETTRPYIISVCPKHTPYKLPDEAVLKQYTRSMQTVSGRLPGATYDLLGAPDVFYTIEQLPHAFFGAEDTLAAKTEIANLLNAEQLPPLTISVLTQEEWKEVRKAVNQSPEFQLSGHINGTSYELKKQGENLDTARYIYVEFTATTTATRDQCKAWAKKAGFRVSAAGDVKDVRRGEYFFWVSFTKPFNDVTVYPLSASIITGLMERYGKYLKFEGLTAVQYKR